MLDESDVLGLIKATTKQQNIDGREHIIGKYYGRTLYEKNIHLDSCTTGEHAHSIDDVDKIISYDSFFRNNMSTFTLPYLNSYQINQSVEIAVNKTNIVLAGGLDLSAYEADIIIRYTKN